MVLFDLSEDDDEDDSTADEVPAKHKCKLNKT